MEQQTVGQTDWQTERKHISPSGFSGKGSKCWNYIIYVNKKLTKFSAVFICVMLLDFLYILLNSFTANVADRRRHSRLPTSPIVDFDPLQKPYLSPFVHWDYVVFK